MRYPPKTNPPKKFAIAGTRSPARETPAHRRASCSLPGQTSGFTLIELLVVIAIIAILVGLLFPAFRAVQNQARQTQAKNDLTQIVNAVNAYYTDYGKYPLPAGVTTDTTYGSPNNDLFYTLRAVAFGANAGNANNPRQIVFINPPYVKTAANPRSGIATQATAINGIAVAIGDYVDPWGTPYNVAIDGGYDNQVANAYTDGSAGGDPNATPAYALHIGVIAWSFGADQAVGTRTPANPSFTNSDDVISWQ
jgi:prepilin-type N-terminal cleavage/methylation domain-containing protein